MSHGSRRSIFEKCDCKRRYSRYYKPPKTCGIVWKGTRGICIRLRGMYSLAPLDEETALCRLFRVLAYKAFGMMTSQSLSKQPLMCRQNHTYQLLSPSRTNPATSWTASAAEKIPRIRDQVSKSCQPEFCNQKLQILHFENLCLLLRVYEKPTSNRRQFRPWGRDPTSFNGDVERIRNASNSRSRRPCSTPIRCHESLQIVCRFLTMSIRLGCLEFWCISKRKAPNPVLFSTCGYIKPRHHLEKIDG